MNTLTTRALSVLLLLALIVGCSNETPRAEKTDQVTKANAVNMAGHVVIEGPTTLGRDNRIVQFASLGAADRPVVAYCGSSLTATHDLLAHVHTLALRY